LCSGDRDVGISLETALVTARQTLASVTERAKQPGYYTGARTDIINAHADLRAALASGIHRAPSTLTYWSLMKAKSAPYLR
jgi:hypothetical protein